MIEKGKTPSGMSTKGYNQSIENFVYATNILSKDINAYGSGDTIKNLVSLNERGEVYEHFKERIVQIDATVPIIAQTYGYTEEQVEEHITDYFSAHVMEFAMEGVLDNLSKDNDE